MHIGIKPNKIITCTLCEQIFTSDAAYYKHFEVGKSNNCDLVKNSKFGKHGGWSLDKKPGWE